MIRRLAIACLALLTVTFCLAHKPSDSYLALKVQEREIYGQWDISLRDLDLAIGLDANGDGEITWGEVRARHQAIAEYALSRLKLKNGEDACEPVATGHLIDRHTDGAYAVLRFTAHCERAIVNLSVDYRLLFDVDAQHRGILKLETPSGDLGAIFPTDRRKQSFSVSGHAAASTFGTFVVDGVRHIAIGVDHILFLIALLLPAVLMREAGQWRPIATLSQALWNVGGIVTAFTLAHSLTLTLAVTGVLAPPSRWVESLIAASVLATAFDNVRPFLPRKRWLVAFVFGLIHGFGFAAVLIDLQLTRETLFLSLFGFNLGVELGQLALVSLVVPLAYAVRERPVYRRHVLAVASLAIAAVSTGWLIDRSLDMRFMPF